MQLRQTCLELGGLAAQSLRASGHLVNAGGVLVDPRIQTGSARS